MRSFLRLRVFLRSQYFSPLFSLFFFSQTHKACYKFRVYFNFIVFKKMARLVKSKQALSFAAEYIIKIKLLFQ